MKDDPATIRRREVFNAGFDAAVRALLTRKGAKTVSFTHPQYKRDREAEFQKWFWAEARREPGDHE